MPSKFLGLRCTPETLCWFVNIANALDQCARKHPITPDQARELIRSLPPVAVKALEEAGHQAPDPDVPVGYQPHPLPPGMAESYPQMAALHEKNVKEAQRRAAVDAPPPKKRKRSEWEPCSATCGRIAPFGCDCGMRERIARFIQGKGADNTTADHLTPSQLSAATDLVGIVSQDLGEAVLDVVWLGERLGWLRNEMKRRKKLWEYDQQDVEDMAGWLQRNEKRRKQAESKTRKRTG